MSRATQACAKRTGKKYKLVNDIYHHIRTVGRFYIWLAALACLQLPARAQIGFQAEFDPIPSWVSPYSEPDYRLSVATPPKSYPVLSNEAMISPAVIRSSFKNKSLTFGYAYHRLKQQSFELVPVSVDALSYTEYQRNQYIRDRGEFMFGHKLAQRDLERGAAGLGVSVALPKRLNKIFGEGGAGLRVSGFRKITFSGRSQWNDGQSNLLRQNRFPSLSMDQISRFDITGTIGSKIAVRVSQDSETDIPLANRIQIRYKGDDDDILKTIEAGNTNLSLPNTQFVGYSERIQGLFGIRTEAQVGSLTLTAIASQEKGNSEKTSFTATGEESATYIRDADFNDNRIFDLGLPAIDTINGISVNYAQELQPGDSIIRLEVYSQETDVNQIENTVYAKIRAKPQDTLRFPEDITPKYGVVRLEYGTEFTFEQNVQSGIYYVVFNTRRLDSRALGVYMEVRRGGSTISFGSLAGDTLSLKLIRAENPLPNYRTWNLMWRNVYDLRQRGASIADLNVKIFKGVAGSEIRSSNLEYQDIDGVSENYIKLLGLDQYSNNGNKVPDGLVDDRSAVWRSDWGLLIFPNRKPFDSDTFFVDQNGTSTRPLQDKVPTLYTIAGTIERAKDSKYYIQIATKTRSSIIRLNRANILEGSERILLNGRPLKAGDDYNINYDFGQITLLSDEALDPNAELTIDYEYAGFLAIQKKTLLGMRAEYEWSKNFAFGSTVLYKSDKAQERKPRVGQETSKMALVDFDANLKLQSNFLTKAVNAIPLVETTVPSAVQLSGEIARSYPNPNVNGEAFVDDFESAIEQLSLSTSRTSWHRAALPKPVENDSASFTRGRLLWHAPVGPGDRLPFVDEVYDREARQGEGVVRTLRMVFKPDPSNAATSKSSWAGITRYFKGRIDADRLQLFEFRARGNRGKIHFDFGFVNEDLDDDKNADTEDNIQPNGFVEAIEDVGLDIVPDGPLERTVFWGTDGDPAGDNFYLSNNSNEAVGKCPYNAGCDSINWDLRENYYRWLNGSEGNRDDAEYLGIPDDEVLSNGSINYTNSYISFDVDLSNTSFLVPNTASSKGFQTYRIPILDTLTMDNNLFEVFTEGGQLPSWATLTHVRIWFESGPADTTEDTLEVADWYFVQSNWKDSIIECDVTDPASCHTILPDSEKTSFLVASLSEEDNVAFKNNPPPGVEQYVDPTTNVAEPRRALLLKFPILQRGDTCTATKELISVDRYSGYGRMEMYVYSDIPLNYSSIVNDSVVFFFRLGTNAQDFYEFRTKLHNSWDKRNWVNIDFNEITALKDSAQKALPPGQRDRFVDISNGKYRVYGDPNLNEILFFSAGLVNTFDTAITGEVWLDELRVTDVRKDAGTAARFNISGNLADFGNFGFQIQSQNAYFRGLSSATRGGSNNNLGSGQTNTSYSVNWSMNLQKFLPPSWSAQLPVSVRYSKSIATPLLRARSDVVLPAEVRKEEQTISETQSLSASESFERKGSNPLFNLLLNRQSLSWSYSRTEGRSVNSPFNFGENYSLKGSFDMGISKVPTLPIFFWTKGIPVIKRAGESRLGLYPNSWMFSANYNRSIRISDDINLKRTTTIARDFSGGVDVRYNVFKNLSTTFNYSTKRDLNNLDEFNLSFKNPKLGTEINFHQNFDLKYDPKLLAWLTWSYSFSVDYGDDYDRAAGTRRSSLGQSWGMGGTFDHRALLSGRAPAGRAPAGRRGGVRTGEGATKQEDRKKDAGQSWLNAPKSVLRFLTGWVEPVTYTYGEGYKSFVPGMLERPALKYRFGLQRDPEVLVTSDTRARSAGENSSYSFGSGFSLFGGITTTVKYSQAEDRELIKSGGPRYRGKSVGWPDMSIRIQKFKSLPLIKGVVNKFIEVFAPRTGYTRRVQESFDIANNFTVSRRVTRGFNPLLSVNFKVWRSFSVSGSYTVDKNEDVRFSTGNGSPQGNTRTENSTIAISSKYSFSAPGGIALPLFGKVKFTSSVDIDVAVRHAASKSETEKLGKGFYVSSKKSDFSVVPTISYSFSRQIRGGLSGRWQDTNDAITNRNSHVRQLQIWVEIRF